jgi:superoxide reductase
MTKKFENYRCDICGNVVFVKQSGGGKLICCGEEMKLVEISNKEVGGEKHLPEIENVGYGRYQIEVGATRHPMTPEHYIEWVEVLTDKQEKIMKFFEPGDVPVFITTVSGKITNVSAYCNTHGLWSVDL